MAGNCTRLAFFVAIGKYGNSFASVLAIQCIVPYRSMWPVVMDNYLGYHLSSFVTFEQCTTN